MSSTKSAASRRRKAKQSFPSSFSISMVITQNLANMVTVAACSGSVLLGLLIARRF